MGVDLSAEIVLRWDSGDNCAPLLEAGGIDTVWLRGGGDAVAEVGGEGGAGVDGGGDLVGHFPTVADVMEHDAQVELLGQPHHQVRGPADPHPDDAGRAGVGARGDEGVQDELLDRGHAVAHAL